MDLNHTETVDIGTRGGTDTVTVDDLSTTDVKQVNVDLGAIPGSVGGDGAPDTVVINGTNASDTIIVTNDNGVVTVTGLATTVTITNFEADDRLVIQGLGGDDVITATGLTGMLFSADGGEGADVLVGSPGSDMLTGGPGDDVLIGNGGQDVLDGGTGNNVVLNAATQAPPATALLGQFMASSLIMAGDGLGTAPIADPQTSQAPLLAQPHA
jgi:Ca2+-binding RTX toxin-like protein